MCQAVRLKRHVKGHVGRDVIARNADSMPPLAMPPLAMPPLAMPPLP